MSVKMFVAAVFLLIAGCGLLDANDGHFIPGEVVVSVKQEVSESFVRYYVARRGLCVKDLYFPEMFLVQVAVEDGDIDEHAQALESSRIVHSLHIRYPSEIRLNIRVEATEDDVKTLLSERRGLRYGHVTWFQKLVTVRVPKGKENRWIRRFGREPWVRSAERNQMASIRSR